MSRVFVAGDWHGQTDWALQTIKQAAHSGAHTIVQLGDFGLWPHGEKYVRKVNYACMTAGIDLLVIPGNHDDYDALHRMPMNADGWYEQPRHRAIRYAPRGKVWQLPNGLWAGALGGAGSIDKLRRVEGKTWWPEEEITSTDVASLITNFRSAHIDHLDVLFTHDAPAGVYRPKFSRPVWITPDVENYCEMQRVLLRQAVDAVRPRTVYHGHWHQWFHDVLEGIHVAEDGEHIPYTANVFGLTRDGMPEGHMVEVSLGDYENVTTESISLP